MYFVFHGSHLFLSSFAARIIISIKHLKYKNMQLLKAQAKEAPGCVKNQHESIMIL